ncbi:uncharacterized protein SPSC_04236 [Sporisorium scitamineum]|uniref:Mig1 protein n=1 Tax=Sporisorium scitamineum TaxID=49012 RepID=A0A127Z3H5_9BASI|nr:uncharacterized protein SPSC_04236 [Sporisorium scitamineum]
MMIPTFLFLFLFLTWSLGVHCDPVDPAPEQDAPYPSPPILPIVYTPVVLSQLCQDPQNYCIYVDQIRPGTVLASPVNATDSQGAFLFRRSDYMERPFHVCYGGCCVDLDFVKRPGCVTMRYVSYPGNGPGHLLARFADNVDNILGPRDDMWRLLEACPPKDEPALPYAVIGARGRHGGRAGKSGKDQQGAVSGATPASPPAAAPDAALVDARPNHDYFDDVTVPLADA